MRFQKEEGKIWWKICEPLSLNIENATNIVIERNRDTYWITQIVNILILIQRKNIQSNDKQRSLMIICHFLISKLKSSYRFKEKHLVLFIFIIQKRCHRGRSFNSSIPYLQCDWFFTSTELRFSNFFQTIILLSSEYQKIRQGYSGEQVHKQFVAQFI